MIVLERRIRKSIPSESNAFYGEGVYLTDMDPFQHGKEEIAKNNWGQGYKKSLHGGKVEDYVKIFFPRGERNLENCSKYGRHVFLYKGDLCIDFYAHFPQSANHTVPSLTQYFSIRC